MKKIVWLFLFSISFLGVTFAQDQAKESSDFQTKSFTVEQGGTLRVDVDPGSVVIESWNKGEVLVEADGVDERRPERLKMSLSNNTVTVQYHDSRRNSERLVFSKPATSIPARLGDNFTLAGKEAGFWSTFNYRLGFI